jgi:hypothetical protein
MCGYRLGCRGVREAKRMECKMNKILRARLARFSLRAVFLAMTVAAVCLSHAAWKDVERRRVITIIEASGGSVKMDDTLAFTLFASERVTEVSLPMTAMAELGAKRLKVFDKLSMFSMTDVNMFIDEQSSFSTPELRIAIRSKDLLDGMDKDIARSDRIAREQRIKLMQEETKKPE